LQSSGMHVDRFISNGYGSIVATSRPTKRPKLLLQAHLDVVPAADDLFTLRGESEKLVGRGAFDMKYAAACFLYLVEELGRQVTDYDFGIMFTTDEELDGFNGVGYLLDQGFGCDICLLPDGGDNWRVESAAKGVWMIDIVCKGVSSHGSRPWLGENAALKLVDFLRDIEPFTSAHIPTETTMSLTRLDAGTARNQIPDRALASFDVRFMNEEGLEGLKQKLNGLLEKYDLVVENERHGAAIQLDVSLPLVAKWEEAVREVRGDNAPNGYALSFGASDARFFAEKHIPVIVTRPDGGGMHSDNEWIEEAGLYQFYDCLKKYMLAISKAHSS
jgi:succinyl-diaminopimelate desuccinylase